MKEYKIALMGARGVGKSSIIEQLLQGTFGVNDRVLELEDGYCKSFIYKNEECMLDLTESLGVGANDTFHTLMELNMIINEGFVLIYSLIDYSSFEYIKTVREQIISIKGTEQVPMVLVGSKGDLADDSRAVETSIAAELAATWPNCRFIETSARNHDEIESVFKHCLDAFEELRYKMQQQKRKKKMKIGKCNVM